MAKRVSARRIKKHRLYTYEEAAEALGVTPQTVRSWRGDGLPVLTAKIPHLIMGHALKEFVAQRTIKAKQPLADDEVFCLRCKAPRKPYGMMADYVSMADQSGRLEALCEVCEGRCIRMVRAADIPRLSKNLEIATNVGWND